MKRSGCAGGSGGGVVYGGGGGAAGNGLGAFGPQHAIQHAGPSPLVPQFLPPLVHPQLQPQPEMMRNDSNIVCSS